MEIPEKVETINSSAFYQAFYNEKGTIVFFNPSFTTIGSNVFSYCKLDNVVLPSVTTTFNSSAFSYSEIDFLDLSNLTLTSIPYSCFYGAKIKKLVLWKNITSINS